jgi:hypothetical protein
MKVFGYASDRIVEPIRRTADCGWWPKTEVKVVNEDAGAGAGAGATTSGV